MRAGWKKDIRKPPSSPAHTHTLQELEEYMLLLQDMIDFYTKRKRNADAEILEKKLAALQEKFRDFE